MEFVGLCYVALSLMIMYLFRDDGVVKSSFYGFLWPVFFMYFIVMTVWAGLMVVISNKSPN